MIVRTYGRRNNRGLSRTYSDSFHDDVSQDTIPSSSSSQDFYNNNSSSFLFSSQESSSFFPSFDPDPYAFNSSQETGHSNGGAVSRKSKKPRNAKNSSRSCSSSSGFFPVTSTTLLEAQEFGEMMEHVDEVNFALDGLKKGQPLRIRRASLASLLSICGTAHQRRLLRTQGIAKTIIDAIFGLSFDDSISNLAAAALFYALTTDGQDDHLLESPSSIRFLIKLLKPVISTSSVDKTRNIGSKLLGLLKDPDVLHDTRKLVDTGSTTILAKVQEILVSCKDMKPHIVDDSGMERPELSPKWIALLTMEKACLSKISFEDASGAAKKMGGTFKEKLRELGGLDAVVEVAMNCHSVMESWTEHSSPPIQDRKDDSRLQSLVLLMKCFKIMENATFLSNDNQNHLLGLKRRLDCHGVQLSFPKLIISAVKILSSLYLHRQYSSASSDGNPPNLSDGGDNASGFALMAGHKDSDEVICISSSANSCSTQRVLSGDSFTASQRSIARLSLSASGSETTTTFIDGTSQLKMRVHCSMSSSCSERLRNCDGATPASNGSRTKLGHVERLNYSIDDSCELLEDSQDPYAFDEDDFEPSKWDLLSGKKRLPKTGNGRIMSRELEDGRQHQLMSQNDSSKDDNGQQNSGDGLRDSQKSSCSTAPDEEYFSLLADCLLTAVKVLMNLTNDNPVGCQQIAACGGLETMSSLIAGHFPFFSSSLSLVSEMNENSSRLEIQHEHGSHLSDQELDLLVAILGLLVNLVEKDGHNRSRLAAISVSLPSSEGLEEKDVIPLLCSIFLTNQGAGDASGDGNIESWNDETAVLQGEKEAEKMIIEAYAALLLAFLSTESKSIRDSIADCLPSHNLAILVPVLERFLAFHLTLNMISPETHKAVNEVIESCRVS